MYLIEGFLKDKFILNNSFLLQQTCFLISSALFTEVIHDDSFILCADITHYEKMFATFVFRAHKTCKNWFEYIFQGEPLCGIIALSVSWQRLTGPHSPNSSFF